MADVLRAFNSGHPLRTVAPPSQQTQPEWCECGAFSAWGVVPGSLRCSACPTPIEQRWWFRLDEWCHRHLPRWMHRPLCLYVERRLWGPRDDKGE